MSHILRAKWRDYHDPGIYMLTLVTNDRQPSLGRLVDDHIELSPLGALVADEIKRIPTYKGFQSAEIYSFVIMPDHFHLLLHVHERTPKVLGQYVSWFKRQCQLLATGAIPSSSTDKHPSGPAPAVSTAASPSPAGSAPAVSTADLHTAPIFANEYHDRILSGRNQLAHMKRYIQDNPRRLALKRANSNLFRIRQSLHMGRSLYVGLGNIFLAEHPLREALHCSRTLTQAEIDALRDECLAKAANGTIFISPAVSEGEKQITRALREAGYPLIILLLDGFPEPDSPHYRYFKPSGVYFEACAAGKLLLLQPDHELLNREDIAAKVIAKTGDISHDSRRYRFVAMNALADEISDTSAPVSLSSPAGPASAANTAVSPTFAGQAPAASTAVKSPPADEK